jgi:hypothetical protein
LSNAEAILLDPPDWPGLGNDQLTAFVEAVNALLDFGIFRPPLATELVRYRDTAAGEISARIAGKPDGPAGKDVIADDPPASVSEYREGS